MPCEKCGHKLILDKAKDELICPECNGMKILSKNTSLIVLKKRVDWFNNAFSQVLDKFDKKRLIAWLIYYREKMCSELFHDKPVFPIRDFLSVNVLIKRVMKGYEVKGEEEANDTNTSELIKGFEVYLRELGNLILVIEDYAYVAYKEEFQLNDLKTKNYMWLMDNFFVVYNEEWKVILDTLNLHNITNKEEAERYYKEHKEEYEMVKNPKKIEKRTIKETIDALYPFFTQLFYGLQLNIVFKAMFNFDYLKKTKITPNHLLKIVTSLREEPGLLNTIRLHDFKELTRRNLKGVSPLIAYENLVFSKKNQDIFPIFVKLDKNIFTPISTTKIIALFLYPLLYRDEYIEVHNKKSHEFEKEEVKELFEKEGGKVYPNFKDKKKNPNFEIDHLVWKDQTLFVVEVKAWDIKPFFESRRIHIYRERDLKGVVDGLKYTCGEPKQIPSLLEKITYVKNNLKEICKKCSFNVAKIEEIKGIVVTKSFPPIKVYNGVKFISYEEI